MIFGAKVETTGLQSPAIYTTSGDVTVNYGLTPEQLKQVTDAAVEGATGPLLDRIVGISKKLGVTADAAKRLLQIVGEQPDVPDELLAEALTKVANDYKRQQAQLAALKPENPTARELVSQARAESDAGQFGRAQNRYVRRRRRISQLRSRPASCVSGRRLRRMPRCSVRRSRPRPRGTSH